jgi:replication-associated recombination protein RarA
METGLKFGMFEHSDIFQDESVFDKGYSPTKISEIIHREKEIETYMRHLSKALKNIVPGNLFIYGKMGIGKTMVTKVLTSEQYLRIKMRILIVHSPNNSVLDNNRCGYTTKRRS